MFGTAVRVELKDNLRTSCVLQGSGTNIKTFSP